jgi:tetratricopeptide (TPR) repeat protein
MPMPRSVPWPALFASAMLLPALPGWTGDASSHSQGPPHSATIIGPTNPLLTAGTEALEMRRYDEGVRLTLAGLEQPNTVRDQAAGHSNVCAGYAALKRWEEALVHCNKALELDRSNWRTFNNRAAVFVGLKQFDLAMTDVNAGLALAPQSATLQKSREVVMQHHNAANRERWRKPNKA